MSFIDPENRDTARDSTIICSKSALNPMVLKLGIISFLMDLSSEMLYPITPIFLTSILGASMVSVGIIEGFAEAVSSILKAFAGILSDRFSKRKPFIVLGYFLSAFSKPLIALSTSWTHVLFARGVDRVGKGIRTAPRDALLADSVDPLLRGAAFGWHRGMDTLGAVLGPLLAVLFLSLSGGALRGVYLFALIPGLFAGVVALTIKESKASPVSKKLVTWTGSFFVPNSLKRFIIAWTVFSIANSSDVFLLMKARSCGFSTEAVIYLYCLYNLSYSLLSPYLGRLSDSIGRRNVLLGGLAIFSLVYLGFGFATSPWQFWLLFGIYGFYMAATEGVSKAYVVGLVDPEQKGTAIGFFTAATGLSAIVAGIVAGILWEQVGSTWPFVYGAAGALGALFLLARERNQLA